MTQPPEVEGLDPAGAERVTVGVRQGWKLPDGVIVFDDGEKVMPVSGLSDQQKRAEALKAALGDYSPAAVPGVSGEEVGALRSEAARLQNSEEINEVRRRKAADLAKLRPAETQEEADKRYKSVPPSAEEQGALLRQRARALVDIEVPRIEELKELASRPGVLLSRDGIVVKGNALAILHNALVEAVTCAERGDVTRTAAALAELRRWSITGAA